MKRSLSVLPAAVLIAFLLSCVLSACLTADTTVVSQKMFLPADDIVPGWRRDGNVQLYDRMNLWRYNDGAADEFIRYGFIELAVQNYVSNEGASLKVEIYRHSKPEEAMGIYNLHRDPAARVCDIGADCYSDLYTLHFWKACYYVRIGVFSSDSALAAAMVDFARAIDERIRGDSALPVESTFFPAECRIEHSLTFTPRGAIGLDWFPAALSAAYTIDSAICNLYVASFDDSVSAARSFERLNGLEQTTQCPFATIGCAECIEWRREGGSQVYLERFGRRIVAVESKNCSRKEAERLFSLVSKRIR